MLKIQEPDIDLYARVCELAVLCEMEYGPRGAHKFATFLPKGLSMKHCEFTKS